VQPALESVCVKHVTAISSGWEAFQAICVCQDVEQNNTRAKQGRVLHEIFGESSGVRASITPGLPTA
jgi:hypothetical protein